MPRRSGLGRGLDSLIPTDLVDAAQSTLTELPIGQIEPNRFQPRTQIDDETLVMLSESIAELGVLQPVLVRKHDDGSYELIAGERRWRAAQRAGLNAIPAIVREVDDEGSLEQALVENLHRQDLNPLEEAAGYQQLLDDFSLTQEDVARRVGRSRSAVTNLLRLLQLPAPIQRMVADAELTAGHARALLGCPDRAFQEALARRVVQLGLSVREVEDTVRDRVQLGRATGDTETAQAPTKGRPQKSAGALELESLLADYLDTRVSIDVGTKKGRVVLEFADLADLERLYRRIIGAPEG